ncbi:MAG: hypothetical protein Q9160_003842 [Pyrenula sp. 1 TL-2023]
MGASTHSFRSDSTTSSSDARTVSHWSDNEQEEECLIRVTAFVLTKQLKLAPLSECYHPEYLHSFTTKITERLLKPSELWHRARRSDDEGFDEITLVCESYFEECIRADSFREKIRHREELRDCRVMECCFRNSDDSNTEAADAMHGHQELDDIGEELKALEDLQKVLNKVLEHVRRVGKKVEECSQAMASSMLSAIQELRQIENDAETSRKRNTLKMIGAQKAISNKQELRAKQNLDQISATHQKFDVSGINRSLDPYLKYFDTVVDSAQFKVEAPSGIHQTASVERETSYSHTSLQASEAVELPEKGPGASVKSKNKKKKKNNKKSGKKANKDPRAEPTVESAPKGNYADLLKRFNRPKIVFHENFKPDPDTGGIRYENLYNSIAILSKALNMLCLQDAGFRIQTEVILWVENLEQCIEALDDAIRGKHRRHGLKILEGKESDTVFTEATKSLETLRESGYQLFDGLNKTSVLSDQARTILRGNITHWSGNFNSNQWLAFEEQFRPSSPIEDCDSSWKESLHLGKARLLDTYYELQCETRFPVADDVLSWLASRPQDECVKALRDAIRGSKHHLGLKTIDPAPSSSSCKDPQEPRSSSNVASTHSDADPLSHAVGLSRDGERNTKLSESTEKPHDTEPNLDEKNSVAVKERHDSSIPSPLHGEETGTGLSVPPRSSRSGFNSLMSLADLASAQEYLHGGEGSREPGLGQDQVIGSDGFFQVVPDFEGFVCSMADMNREQNLLSLGAAHSSVNNFMILTSPIIVSQITTSTNILAAKKPNVPLKSSIDTSLRSGAREKSAFLNTVMNPEPSQSAPNQRPPENAARPTPTDPNLQATVSKDFQLFQEPDPGDKDSILPPLSPQERRKGNTSIAESAASPKIASHSSANEPTTSFAERAASPQVASPSSANEPTTSFVERVASPKIASPSSANEPAISVSPQAIPADPNPSPPRYLFPGTLHPANNPPLVLPPNLAHPPQLRDYDLKDPLPATHYLHHTIILPPLSDERDTQPFPHETPVIQRRAVPQLYHDPYLGLQQGLWCTKCGTDGYTTKRSKERDWRSAFNQRYNEDGQPEEPRPNTWDAIEELGIEEVEGFGLGRPRSMARAVIFILPACGTDAVLEDFEPKPQRMREFLEAESVERDNEEPAPKRRKIEKCAGPETETDPKGKGKGKGKEIDDIEERSPPPPYSQIDPRSTASNKPPVPKPRRNLPLPYTGTFRDDAAVQIAANQLGTKEGCWRCGRAVMRYWRSVAEGLVDGTGAVVGDWQGGRIGRVVEGFW